MKYQYGLLVFLFGISLMLSSQAFAQVQDCRICVAKKFYEQGETVVISGKVDAVLEKTPIIIQIFYGSNLAEVAQVEVAQDGTFTHTVVADGIYFKNSGNYTVKGTYGISSNAYETSFEFHTSDAASAITEIFEVKAGDSGTFDVPYTIRGGTVTNMFVDPDMLALVVQIESNTDGTILLDLGRQWIDAKKQDGTDDTYIVQIDGVQVPYQESSVDADSRIVTIQFLDGDSDIEIIGTHVVPEFGPVVMIVLVASIVSVIFATARRGIPRF